MLITPAFGLVTKPALLGLMFNALSPGWAVNMNIVICQVCNQFPCACSAWEIMFKGRIARFDRRNERNEKAGFAGICG